MNDVVNHPNHYIKNAIVLEPIELTGRLNSCIGQALQYVIRRKDKGSELEDLQKAEFWLNWYKENIAKRSAYLDDDELNVGDSECDIYVEKFISAFASFSKDDFTGGFINDLFVDSTSRITMASLDRAIEHLEEEIERLKAQEKQETAGDHFEELKPNVWYTKDKFDGNPKDYWLVEISNCNTGYIFKGEGKNKYLGEATIHFMYIEPLEVEDDAS